MKKRGNPTKSVDALGARLTHEAIPKYPIRLTTGYPFDLEHYQLLRRQCVHNNPSAMATSTADPLTSLRRSIASNNPPIATTSSTPTEVTDGTDDLAIATHLQFPEPDAQIFSLEIPTRFISSDKPVDLRSIYFAWQKKDVAIPDYIAATQQLNDELAGKATVQNLVFVERLNLITWLEGASEESEYIKVSDADSAARSAQVASGAAGGVSTIPSSAAGARAGKAIDPRLQEIYNGERRMGDRNSILRGIKPTVIPPSPPPPHLTHTPLRTH